MKCEDLFTVTLVANYEHDNWIARCNDDGTEGEGETAGEAVDNMMTAMLEAMAGDEPIGVAAE